MSGGGELPVTINIDLSSSGSCDISGVKLKAGSTITCTYCGAVKYVKLAIGSYTVEVWGGAGASGRTSAGAGGYAKGTLTLSSKTLLYLCTGGGSGNTYNGGGGGNGGGGASHIGLKDGLLTTYSSDYSTNLIICAGGGGGGGKASGSGAGGSGGGTNGGAGVHGRFWFCGYGGTQTSGGAPGNYQGSEYFGAWGTFGQGGGSSWGGGGGGGGLYGGGGGATSWEIETGTAGGGGSGYVNTTYLTDTSMTNGARSGNGYICITVL